MSLVYASAAERFEAAEQAYQAGRPADAARLLDAVLQSNPRSVSALYLMGMCLLDLGDLAQAEKALRASLAGDRRRPAVHAALGHLLQRTGRLAEAEKAYRAGLALDRRHGASVCGLAELMLQSDRPKEALQLTTPVAVGADPGPRVLDLHAEALRRLGRLDESLEASLRGAAAGNGFSELGAAATLRELARYPEAEAAARRAVAAVGEHPAAMVSLGRMLEDQGRHEEAEAVYRQGLTRAALDPALHMALAGLMWARTGDPDKAATPLDSVLRQRATPPLLGLRARMHTRAGHPDKAYAMLAEAMGRAPDDPSLLAMAATAAVNAGDAEAGLAHAEQAQRLAPDNRRLRILLAETLLAAGQPDRAAALVDALRVDAAEDQQLLAMQAAAWRLVGDPRYRDLYDYGTMVQAFTLPTPDGWSGLPAYLADLSATLKSMHTLRGDPLDQSLRGGTQTQQNLAFSSDPVVRAFFKAVDAPVAEYLARLGKGRDPLRARNGSGHRIWSGWSVRLEPDGFHADHVHSDGWLSSAFYVELPDVIGDDDRQGWLKFGQPGLPTRPALDAEHFVRPEPGRLVLFPSYMWHGTVPFGGTRPRLTMAFDVVPGK